MGAVFSKFRVANPLQPSRENILELLVDTGALYSVLPAHVLRSLGIEPFERKVFKTADGHRVERAVGEAVFSYEHECAISKVVFGGKNDPPRLGKTALLALGLEKDDDTGELRPAKLFLYPLMETFSSGHGFSRAETVVSPRGFSP